MVEPLSAYAIATLAFISGNAASTVVGKLTETALEKANELRKKIWAKFRGKEEAEKALKAAEEGKEAELETVAKWLKDAMQKDPDFAKEIQALAKEIEGEIDDDSPMMMIIRDRGTGYQTKVNARTSFVGGTHHHHQD
ncbi:hypothetical protein [Lusitaniella coriacea]|uniref:hypothetical protein n=1 Tax=Lusitaniella coriacea TaxID=1983105 RepID=UPI003CF57629